MRVLSVMSRCAVGVVIGTAALLPLGCAAARSGDAFQPEVVQPDQAVLYIYRESHGIANRSLRISVNQQDLGELRSGEYLAAVVTPGAFLVRASSSSSSAARELRLHGGDVAYLRVTGNAKPAIDEPETDVAQSEIAKTRRLATK